MSDQLTNFDDVMQRLALATGAEHDAALARLLGMSTSDFAQRKKRQKVPLDRLVAVAGLRNISVDWLLTGGRNVEPPATPATSLPSSLSGLERRIDSLLGVLAQLSPEDQEAVLSECFTRAATAQQLAELKQAVQDLEATKRSKAG